MTIHRSTTGIPGTTTPGPAARNRTARRRLARTEVVFHTASGSRLIANAPPGVRPALRVRMRRGR